MIRVVQGTMLISHWVVLQGYDAIAIASILGLETFGTDVSTTAIEAARK